MTDAIGEGEYADELDEVVTRLLDAATDAVDRGQFEDEHTAVMEMVSEELEYHNWFARTYYDGALYGSIIEHADTDPARYSDWSALVESEDPEQTLKRLAYVVMEAEVLDEATSRLGD